MYLASMSAKEFQEACQEAQEAHLVELAEGAIPASFDASKGLITLTVIQPGFNKSKQRYYPAEVLQRDHKVFEGAKMFIDHATDAEVRSRPEGSLKNWVANLKRVWTDAKTGAVMGEAVVIDPAFKKKLEMLRAAGELPSLGVSIRAAGQAEPRMIEGQRTNYISQLYRAHSVDFVTFAGAGGQVEALESATPTRSRLVESFMRFGLTREEAEIAAKIK